MLIYTLLSINILKDEVGGLQPTYSFIFQTRTHLKLQEYLLSEAWKSLWISITYSERPGKSQKWACLCNHDNKYLYIMLI